jgi:LmbE family N-acetylglucosaminyl deacetylase
MTRQPDIVFLSPHFDDAVISVGGLINREVAAGREVGVWTCFTEGPSLNEIPPALHGLGDYATRKAEDLRALAILGAGHRWLELRERIWREPPLSRDYHIFHTPPELTSFTSMASLRLIVRELLEAGVELVAPLGVGHHHDHVEVTLAVILELLERPAFDRVRFYEDPYALGGACRRAHIVTRGRTWRFYQSPGWASPRMAMLVMGASMAARGPHLQDYVPDIERLHWSCAPAPVEQGHEQRKLAAVAEYRSQIAAFGGIKGVRAFLRRGHELLGGEPLWHARPAADSSG